MKLIVRNKVDIGGGSSVYDEYGKEVFTVKGKTFSVTRKKFIMDANGNKLYTVRRKFWRGFSRASLIYDADDNKVLKMYAKAFAFENKYRTKGYDGDLILDAKAFSGKYDIIEDEKIIGVLRRTGSLIVDEFELEFEDESRAAFFVAPALAVDSIRDEEEEERRKK